MHRPRIIAHRGASGHAHENSFAAFALAVEMGADGVELDIHATRDGRIVVHHDSVVPGLGPIAGRSLAELRTTTLPNGEPIPLLAEVLASLGQCDVWVEVKRLDAGSDQQLLSVLGAGPAPGRYAVHSFDHRIVARLRREHPSLRTGILMTSHALDSARLLRSAGASALWQEHELIDGELVGQVHAAGCELIAWTVNDPADLERLVALGVDGLCGNFPDRIRAAVAGMGRAAP